MIFDGFIFPIADGLYDKYDLLHGMREGAPRGSQVLLPVRGTREADRMGGVPGLGRRPGRPG